MTDDDVRAYALSGPDAAAALDWLHVNADVRGVIEADTALTVFVAGPWPRLPFAAVAVAEVPMAPEAYDQTGLENDTVVIVAEDLIVRPPWVERPVAFAGVELVVPRGNAFGSGEHESTQAALRCLHTLWQDGWHDLSCADVGTGSGILLLYAAVRGCRRLQACDIEEPAVAAARALVPEARVHLGGPDTLEPADCVIANMTASELHAALPSILRVWNRRGPLVLSGLRDHEVDAMCARLPTPPDHTESRPPFVAIGLLPGTR